MWGWPGFLCAAPEVQNTARNTDGFWVIRWGERVGTQISYYKMLLLCLPLILRRNVYAVALALCSSCCEHKEEVVWHPCDVALRCYCYSPLVSKHLAATRVCQGNQPTRGQGELNSLHVRAAGLISWFPLSAEEMSEAECRFSFFCFLVSCFLFLRCLCRFHFSTMTTESVPLISSCQP